MHTAYSRRQAPKATASRRRAQQATADRTTPIRSEVRDRLAGLDSPQMPTRLAAKITDAIAAESARRGFDTKSSRRLVTTR